MLGEFLLDNFSLVVTVVLFVAAALLTGKRRAWFEWANETLFLAFDNAEQRGLLEGLKGQEKLTHYLTIWRQAYAERFGKEPDQKAMEYAVNKAAELASKEKTVRQKVESLANPK